MNLLQKHPGVIIDAPIGKHRIVHCALTRQYYRLGVREADFFEELDGMRTVEELRRWNAQGFRPEQVDGLLAWFTEHRLLGNLSREDAKVESTWYERVWRFILRPDQFRIRLLNPERFLNRHRASVDLLFSRGAIALYLFLLLSPALVCLVDPKLAVRAAHAIHQPSTSAMLLLYVLLLLVNVLHEFAHAIACKHFGGKVEKIGLMFLYINPVIYCDVSDSWRFPSVNQKVTVTLAGIFLQLLISAAGLSTWLFTGSSFVLQFVIFNTVIAFFNLFPFIKLDGYWMLVHLVDEPNLKAKGLNEVNGMLRRVLLRSKDTLAQSSRPLIMAYGFGNMLAVPLFWLMGLWGLYGRVSRASPILALAVVALFGGSLLYRATKSVISFSRPIVQ